MSDRLDVLLLNGYFESELQKEIEEKTKTWVENAANTFEERLIKGLRLQDINLDIVSAPLFGAWPKAYKDITFNGFDSKEDITYVPFNNIWGYRNISRANSLIKDVDKFINKNVRKAIIVYCLHTPFLKAAIYAKRKDPSIHIHVIVPDLPEYMNLSKGSHKIYDLFKSFDIKKIDELLKEADSFTLLTSQMKDRLNVGSRPYLIKEGIVEDIKVNKVSKERCVTYTGKLEESFGVKHLLDSFSLIKEDIPLYICGNGELKEYITDLSNKDKRIKYLGSISPDKAKKLQLKSLVLVNPRRNENEYTKYSFPSKVIEYLSSGNNVVSYYLDGMKEEYKDFLFIPKDNSKEELANTITKALNSDNDKSLRAIDYLNNNLNYKIFIKGIIDLINESILH